MSYFRMGLQYIMMVIIAVIMIIIMTTVMVTVIVIHLQASSYIRNGPADFPWAHIPECVIVMEDIRDPIAQYLFSRPALLVSCCRRGRRPRRRKGRTIRLGNRRQVFCLGTRPVARWNAMARSIRVLKKIVMEIAWSYGRSAGPNLWSLPILRPQMFPLC